MSFSDFGFLVSNIAELADWRYVTMWVIGGLLIFLAIKYEMEPTLLLPLGFGTILVNIPFSGALDRTLENGEVQEGALSTLFSAGIANELFPLILFIGIGAMIDFGPLLSNPKLMIFGAAAQFGIFFTFCADVDRQVANFICFNLVVLDVAPCPVAVLSEYALTHTKLDHSVGGGLAADQTGLDDGIIDVQIKDVLVVVHIGSL